MADDETTGTTEEATATEEAAPQVDESAAKAAELDKANKALAAKLAQLEKEDGKRKAEDRKKADKKRAEEEGAQKLLEEKAAENEALRARVEAFEKAQREIAEAKFATLPEAVQAELAIVKDDLTPEKWAALVDARAKSVGEPEPKEGDEVTKPGKKTPPPTGSPGLSGPRKGETYEPSQAAIDVLEANGMGRHLDRLKGLQYEPGMGNTGRFVMPTKDQFQAMKESAQKSAMVFDRSIEDRRGGSSKK